jgi:hypothetical protein
MVKRTKVNRRLKIPKSPRTRLIVFAGAFAIIGSYLVISSFAATSSCVGTATTTSNFANNISAASSGATLCLASGNYGTWGGTNKAITIKAADGASPQMQVNFGSGDSGFTLDGMTGMGGGIKGASNITIKNSVFTDSVDFEGGSANVNVVMDGNTHNWNAVYSGGINAKVFLGSGSGTLSAPSVTIKNSEFKNGDLDGIHLGDGAGYVIQNNIFDNLCDVGTNHTDNIQFDTSVVTQTRIAGNYVHAGAGCGTQGITSFDHGTNGVIIENNLVDIRRPWAIELYSDVNSIVRHNTVVYYPSSQCDFNTPCGRIDIDRKSADPAGTGTQAYDNLATVEFNAGSTGTAHHNASSQTAVYVGPATRHDGFLLASNSPVGLNAASDSTDIGIYATGGPSPPTLSLTANPTSISSGSSSTLSWSSTNATSCTASGAWSGSKATSGTQSVSPTSTSTYNLACTGSGGTANASATVTVTSGGGSGNTGDLNNDGVVNITDLSILLSSWNTTNSTADINKDGTVNILDLSILLSNYGKTYSGGGTTSCALPAYPDSSCTGVPAGTTLTNYSGPTTITANNTVIDGKIFSGGVEILATGVIIKNSIINGPVSVDDAANYARSNNGTTPVVTIMDSKIDCQNAIGSSGVNEAHYAVKRVEIVRCENGFDMNQNILIEDSYIHNLGNGGTDPHSDGAQCAGGRWNGSSYVNGAKNLTLRHNRMYGMSTNDTAFETSAIICGTGTGGTIIVDSNLLAGGAYTLYCIRGGPGPDFRVTNNHFSTIFKSTVGAYGPSDSCHDEIISGNVMHETGAPINFANDD